MNEARRTASRTALALAGLLGGVCLVAGGCGSSPRSAFYEMRGITATPVAGSGETLGLELAAALTADAADYAALPQSDRP